jgi:hypothetical protein
MSLKIYFKEEKYKGMPTFSFFLFSLHILIIAISLESVFLVHTLILCFKIVPLILTG